MNVLLFEGVTPGAVDYSAIVTKVEKQHPDLVVWGGYHPEASKIVVITSYSIHYTKLYESGKRS